MRSMHRWILALAFGAPLMLAPVARADDEPNENHPHLKITMSDLPAAARATIQREAKGKEVEWVAKEVEHGKTVYEAEIVSGGKGVVIEVGADGKVLERHAPHVEKGEKNEHR